MAKKWKEGLPKWRKKLGKELNQHLIDTISEATEPITMAKFFSNRTWQVEKHIDCWDCEQIERKLNE